MSLQSSSRSSSAAKAKILQVAQSELSQNMDAQSNLNSMYYSGKVSVLIVALLMEYPLMIDIF